MLLDHLPTQVLCTQISWVILPTALVDLNSLLSYGILKPKVTHFDVPELT